MSASTATEQTKKNENSYLSSPDQFKYNDHLSLGLVKIKGPPDMSGSSVRPVLYFQNNGEQPPQNCLLQQRISMH